MPEARCPAAGSGRDGGPLLWRARWPRSALPCRPRAQSAGHVTPAERHPGTRSSAPRRPVRATAPRMTASAATRQLSLFEGRGPRAPSRSVRAGSTCRRSIPTRHRHCGRQEAIGEAGGSKSLQAHVSRPCRAPPPAPASGSSTRRGGACGVSPFRNSRNSTLQP